MAARSTDGAGSPDPPRPSHRHRRWIVLAVCALVLLTIGFGVRLSRSPAYGGPITKRSDLQKLPEERLFYPGAVLLGSGGNNYEWGIWGSNGATSGHTLGANASKDEVLAFYDRELTARGWQKLPGVGVGSAELAVWAWRKDKVSVWVAILRTNDPRNPTAINAYQTPYRITLIADRP